MLRTSADAALSKKIFMEFLPKCAGSPLPADGLFVMKCIPNVKDRFIRFVNLTLGRLSPIAELKQPPTLAETA